MNRTDRYILSCPTWDEFYRRTGSLSEADKGRIFERLVQLYLQTAPEYRTILQDVWLLRDVPPKVRQELKLPLSDEGIDLIARRGAANIGPSRQSSSASMTRRSA